MLTARPTASLRRLPLLAFAAAVLLSGAGCPSESDLVASAPPGTHVPAPPTPDASPAVYTAGQPVHVNWSSTWYVGRVLDVGAGETAGQYRIHYDGWADSWDAWSRPRSSACPRPAPRRAAARPDARRVSPRLPLP